jgi:hypothetical protein
MRRFLLSAVAYLFWISLAAAQSIYEIDLRDHANYLSADRPIERGRVVVFHRYPDGALLSIQKDEVARVARVTAGATNRALAPGEAIDVGPTANLERQETPAPEQDGAVIPPAYTGGGGYGGGAPKNGSLPTSGLPYSLPPGATPTMGNPMSPSPPRGGGHR